MEFFEISRFKKLTIILHKKTNYYFTSKKNRAFLHICPLRPQLNPKPYFTCIKPCIYLELSLSIYLKLLFCLHNGRRTQKLSVILPVEPLKWGGVKLHEPLRKKQLLTKENKGEKKNIETNMNH